MMKARTSLARTRRSSSTKRPPLAPDPRQLRQQALAEVRRELVLDAARAAFFELGMEKTSMREIAHRAGYTPGAIYSYFPSKEALYGVLLGESLDRLNQRVETALAGHAEARTRARAGAMAFFAFYRENPHDLDLGFYLFHGTGPRGLTPELNTTLNTRLRQALQPTQDALHELGMSEKQALEEITALFAHAVGLLVLKHTGRIRMFRQTSQELFSNYLERLIERAGAVAQPE